MRAIGHRRPMHDRELVRFWGKASPELASGPVWHPLVFHSLDVAAVAKSLVRWGWARPTLRLLAPLSEEAADLVVWLVALHDVGKFHDAFQIKVPGLAQSLQDRTLRGDVGSEPHDRLRLGFLCKHSEAIASAFSQPVQAFGFFAEELEVLLSAVCGHHGSAPCAVMRSWEDPARTAASRFVGEMTRLVLPSAPLRLPGRGARLASFPVNGLAILADWIGSDQQAFPYRDPAQVDSLDDYWRDAQRQADRRVRELLLHPKAAAPTPLPYTSFASEIRSPTPLQRLAAEVSIGDVPTLVLIEEATGAGKTEAALQLGLRMIDKGLGERIYVALPTMATATGIHRRFDTSRFRGWFRGVPSGVCWSTLRRGTRPAPTTTAQRRRRDPGWTTIGRRVCWPTSGSGRSTRPSWACSRRGMHPCGCWASRARS